MLDDYVIRGNRSWERLAPLGLVVVSCYSALRLAAYY